MSDMQKDLVLSINEFAYVLDKTKGNVSCWVGPAKTSLSTSDELVVFNQKTKRFESCSYTEAIRLFVTAPENWYVILKNPTNDNRHPNQGTSNVLPETIKIGCKVNITGPISFALYPGQMAKVIQGHSLRSNQYLLARVYDAESANKAAGTALDTSGKPVETNKKSYITGQLLIIKGTQVSFYIPPTGIEVLRNMDISYVSYIRDAVTLERLEYCILKDEDGNKRYMHGPDVIFPEPTETFVTSPKGGFIFKAIELSKISGVYVKVIAEYADGDGTVHPVGEELFLTGDKQMIYYPRPEHAIINYDNKILHHAIAIPSGEGRYVMDRLTGVIKTIKGPAMYLPDPRTEVVVKRKLTTKQCEMWYPGNLEALQYNAGLTEKSVEKNSKSVSLDEMTAFSVSSRADNTLAYMEANAGISRGTSYTKPRTITLDNKFDGVVSMDIWTGYAVNVISKNGIREVVCGPRSIMLDYDQTLEVLEMSTGKPKTTDHLLRSVYLRCENNKVSDIIGVETNDFVSADIKVSYCVDFLPEHKDKWFSVENYVKFFTDRIRSLVKKEAKKYTIEEFYKNYSEIVHDIVLNVSKSTDEATATEKKSHTGRFFKENGMLIKDVEILSLHVQRDIQNMLDDFQEEAVRRSLELTNAEQRVYVAERLSDAISKEAQVKNEEIIYKFELQQLEAIKKMEIKADINRRQEAEDLASKLALQDMQIVIDLIQESERIRKNKLTEDEIAKATKLAEIEDFKQKAYAKTISDIMTSITPDLVAALNSTANSSMLEAVTASMSPYAIAQGESIADTVNKLLRGTSLEGLVDGVNVNV